jgi:hypothetical protein
MKYKLNVNIDVDIVDTEEEDIFILNLPKGWKFTHDPMAVEHVRGYDSMKELHKDIKQWVSACDCAECKS